MKNSPIFVLALAAISSVSLMAQQPSTAPQEPNSQTTSPQTTSPPQSGQSRTPLPESTPSTAPRTGNSAAEPVPSTANAPEVSNPQLRPVSGELESKLDTKSAKTGDSVVVKTTEPATTAGGVVIPKGSKIVGHVTDVEAKGKSSENSRVTIQFDRAELKGGQNMPIKSVLQSVEPSGEDSSAMAGGAYAGTARGGSATAGGTNAGAATPGTSSPGYPNADRTAPGSTGPGSTGPGSTGPGSTGPASNGAASGVPPAGATGSPSAGGPAVGTVIARNGNVAIRTTAIPGVLLANNADGQPFANAAGALLGAKKDVQLDSGTHVVVAITDAGAKSNR